MDDLHYLLRRVKDVRNATAHSSLCINDFPEQEPGGVQVPSEVSRALAKCGVSKRTRSKNLKSPKVSQICTLVYLYARIVPDGETRSERKQTLGKLFGKVNEAAAVIPTENPAMSSLAFIERLTRGSVC